ncbi:NADPH2:quinone reductase [Sphingomonas guangdongensis]|uniref:NADPH2:quinone reductase n=1 Tax=Sphingomonas guangdongensis TaxID=1141890 RepID=A0A285QBF2_9SPHN|nr:quinone oxidoreductase [Sphingomonas guangdongensis]SOB79275.1 NADPH2:quinone reductase [Sphingomonas guangdongensis]
MKARAVRIERTGGPEVIEWHDVDLAAPGTGEVLLRHTAVGLNYIDTYHRSGLYPVALPAPLGSEAVGVVEAIGPEVTGVSVGDRVGTFGPSRGAYATARIAPAAELIALPETVDDRTAAALLLKGGTTEFLVDRCARVTAGQSALVWAAAGGVGHLLVGWLKARGAAVIGIAGGAEKGEAVLAAGADHVLDHRQDDIAARVREITGGVGADVVFDGVGQASWDASLKATKRRGLIASFGNASGAVTGIGLGALAQHGSLFVTRPTMFDYYTSAEERAAGFASVWDMLARGAIRPEVGQTFALEQVADAHRGLEAGETRGSTVLVP